MTTVIVHGPDIDGTFDDRAHTPAETTARPRRRTAATRRTHRVALDDA